MNAPRPMGGQGNFQPRGNGQQGGFAPRGQQQGGFAPRGQQQGGFAPRAQQVGAQGGSASGQAVSVRWAAADRSVRRRVRN